MEFWNLVFMQYDVSLDGTKVPLPKPSIDTGAGIERCPFALQGVKTVWETEPMRPLIAVAEDLTGVTYGGYPGTERDVSLRLIRSTPATRSPFSSVTVWCRRTRNEVTCCAGIIRRVVCRTCSCARPVTPTMVDAAISSLASAQFGDRREPTADRRQWSAVKRPAEGATLERGSSCSTRSSNAATSPAKTVSACTTRTGSRSS